MSPSSMRPATPFDEPFTVALDLMRAVSSRKYLHDGMCKLSKTLGLHAIIICPAQSGSQAMPVPTLTGACA